MSNRTFTMIKPDAFKNGHAGAILDRILQEGYNIKALKMTKLTPEKAGEFYAIHKERPFYGELVSFMCEGPIIAAILEKDNAVEDFRKLILQRQKQIPFVNYTLHQLVKMQCMEVIVMKMQRLKAILCFQCWSNSNYFLKQYF